MSLLHLPSISESVPVARRFVREQLADSECDIDTAVLLASELVTNAVLHARGEITLSVVDQGATARIEVGDGSSMPPRVHGFSVESATGRGLRLVDRLATRWGAVPSPSGAGKMIWCEVGEPSAAAWESFTDLQVDG